MVAAVGGFLSHCETVAYRVGAAGLLIAIAVCPGTDVQAAGPGHVMPSRRATNKLSRGGGIIVNGSRVYWKACMVCRAGNRRVSGHAGHGLRSPAARV